jgi:signal transduction histidine kinase
MRQYRHRTGRPPWWPLNEPWPPVGRHYRWQHGRRAFLFRVAGVFVVSLVFGAIGLTQLLTVALARAGLTLPPPIVAFAIFAVVFVLPLFFFGAMRRVGLPLGDIVAAADRVGSGDYSARIIERGPPFLRSVARAFNSMTVRLEAQERQRRDLMADIAHELRTPLSIMRGRLEGLVDGVYPRDDATLTQLVDETKLLQRLVEDLRTLAHAEGGTLKLQREATDLSVLIHDVVHSFAGDAETGGVAFRAAGADDLPLVDVDPLRIREVLGNLIANAIRHTPSGGTIVVSAEKLSDRISVRVTDTGTGIPSEELPRIFDRFSKGADSRGSGLGLTIARNLIAAHSGEIKAESRVGQGTSISFTLPTDTP